METTLRGKYISVARAAEMIGYTPQHTRLLIRAGKLAATKVGRDWLIREDHALAFVGGKTRSLPFLEAESAIEEPDAGGTIRRPRRSQEGNSPLQAVNVAQVPQRSPFRYPGGKTWLVPYVRRWLRYLGPPVEFFVEPFAGGAIAALTAVFEDLANHAVLVELDEDVASVWQTILRGNWRALVDRIADFQPTREAVQAVLTDQNTSREHRAFVTIVRNRIARGGILAPGAGIVRNGENGRGLASRWYPDTLCRRIEEIAARRSRFSILCTDGLKVLQAYRNAGDCVFFVDPPYTVSGRRLYRYCDIDHAALFATLARLKGSFLTTYDDAPEIRGLAEAQGLKTVGIAMKTTHHAPKTELLISRDLDWLDA